MRDKYKYEDGLQTERLTTRFIRKDDAELWKAFFEDKDCTEFIPDFGLKSSLERSQHWIDRQLARYSEKRYGHQFLINKNTKEVVGQCGLLLQDIDGIKELEVGYHIFKHYWGKGYAPEAAIMFRNYGLQNNLADSIISVIDINNVKSQKVATKNGMYREKQTKWMGMNVFIYRIKKLDWENNYK
jgi:ribosomal-protein-alanine N-acetyltransferase